MAYTLATVRTDIKDRLRNSNYTDALVDQYINASQRHITNRYKFRFMENTFDGTVAQGTYVYALPTDFSQAISFRITDPDGDVIDLTHSYLDVNDFDQYYTHPDADNQGTPMRWTIYGDNFHVYPIPDGTYTLTLRYLKTATILDEDSDVPEIPETFQEALITGALYRILQSDDLYDEASLVKNEHIALVEDMVNRNNKPQVGQSSKIAINRVRTNRGL